MRRALLLIPLVILALLAWLVLSSDLGDGPAGDPSQDDAAAVDADAEEERERVRAREQEDRRERSTRPPGNRFQQEFPELGQDVPQDPSLGAITGRVMVDRKRAAGGGVLEASASGRLLARVHIPADGRFLLKNVPPGSAYAVTARLDGHAPGGLDRIGVGPGETFDTGTVYVGAAIGPDVDNRVRVVVLDENAEPIRGAEVTASTVFYGALLTLAHMEKQPGGSVLRATTDANGEVEFERIPPAAYDIFAVADGYSFRVRQRLTIQRDTKTRYEIRLEPGLTIAGQVVDTEGNPLAGARVGGLRWNEFTSVPAVDCDEEGRFVLKGVRGGQPYFVFAMADGIGGRDMQNIQAGTQDLRIEIEPGGAVVLEVVDASTGEPLPEFMLRPYQNVPFAYMYAPAIEAKPDADGTYSLHMTNAEYGMEISADGYALERLPRVKIPTPDVVEVPLQPAGVVSGRVLSKVDGRPVVGADVFVKKGGFPPSKVKDLITTTDAEGRFVLDRLPPRTLSLWISHVDHTEALFEGVEPQVAAGEGEAPAIRDFELGSGGRIEGLVLGDDGLPLTGQEIVLSAGFDFMSARNTATDAKGHYVFRNVPLGKTYTVSVGAFVPGQTGQSKSGVTVAENTVTTVDFGTETGGVAVSGVVTRNGEPVANAQVSILSDDGGDALVQERTDAVGRFTFSGVQAGKYQITVNRRGNVSTPVVVGEEPPAELTIELPTAEVTGLVLDPDGAPVSGSYVECERIGEGGASNLSRLSQAWAGNSVTGEDGVFRITGLSDATYRVRAQAGGFGTVMSEDFVVKDGESVTGLRLRLTPACTVTGFVRNAEGTPVSGASLTILDSQGRSMTLVDLSQSSSDGSYTASQLAPGTYTLSFRKDGYARASRTLNVTAGKVLEIDFTLLQGGQIELSVLNPADEAVKGAVVVVLDAAGQPIQESFTLENMFSTRTVKTDAKGRVTVPGLAPGTYRLRVTKGGAESTSDPVDVFEGGSTPLEMRLLGEGETSE
jgi:protocatechuate 3,4-dioxygenase beta subunit